MFGEKYPDPVRVVSIGADLDEILKNFTSEKWINNSIEFCGGTHISNTREAMKFVIVEQSSLGSGIRRIVALTGDQALEASGNVKNLMNLLEILESKSNEILSEALKDYNILLSETPIPLYNKNQILHRLEPIRDRVTEEYKRKLSDTKKSSNSLKLEIMNRIKNENINIVVEVFEVGGSKKILGDIINEIKKEVKRDFAIMLFSVDLEENKIICSSKVGDSLCKQLSAIEWVRSIFDDKTPKGEVGGSPKVATGQISIDIQLHDLVREAIVFGRHKLGTD